MTELIRNAGKQEGDTSTFPAFLLSLLVFLGVLCYCQLTLRTTCDIKLSWQQR
jgi:hypothetical protein